MQRFSHLSNQKGKLGLSTPYAQDSNGGLTLTSSIFNYGDFSLAFRFKVNNNTHNGTFFKVIDSVSAKTEYYYVDVSQGMLRFGTSAEGSQNLCTIPAINTIYHLWIDSDWGDVNYYLYDNNGGFISAGQINITPLVIANAKVFVLNDSGSGNYLQGTMFDLVYLDSCEGGYKYLFLAGGASKAFVRFWPMREGSGDTCTCALSGAELGPLVGGIGWTTAPDNSFRWI